MEITSSVARRISQFAWVMAAAGTVIGQVHALARAQAHPDDFVESPLARVWGEPAIRMLQPLLDWSDPWTVYVTYGKIWLPVCLAFSAAAYLVYRRRRPQGTERRLWQVTLAGYAVMTLVECSATTSPRGWTRCSYSALAPCWSSGSAGSLSAS